MTKGAGQHSSQKDPPAKTGRGAMPLVPRVYLSRIRLPLACLALAAASFASAQQGSPFPSSPAPKTKPSKKKQSVPQAAPVSTFPPTLTIPVEPLGFSTPSETYLSFRYTFVSLDFLNENQLLFTFRVPGLLHRDKASTTSSDERQIRAVVLTLPTGAVAAEALWRVHDHARYLWMLKDSHFLLRDQDGIQQGDATLAMKPLLNFPGPLISLELDPSQQLLVTNSYEPAGKPEKPGDVSSPSTAQASMTVDDQKPGVPDTVVRILQRETGQVMLVSRVRNAVHLPINAEGYLEALRGNADLWIVNEEFFTGGTRQVGRVSSACAPALDFISQRELLVTACDNAGRELTALSVDGNHLWNVPSSAEAIWPIVMMSPDGSRLARETLTINHDVNAYSPLDAEDIKGQWVRVLDAANGKTVLDAPASPPLDAGGNVALSPSGRRLAVINAGSIEVYDLPVAAALPDSVKPAPSH